MPLTELIQRHYITYVSLDLETAVCATVLHVILHINHTQEFCLSGYNIEYPRESQRTF
jgi:hypothetical protein